MACTALKRFFPEYICSAAQARGTSARRVALPSAANPAVRLAQQAAAKPVVVQAYPNPAREQVGFDTAGFAMPVTQVQLISATAGQLVLDQVSKGTQLTIPVTHVAPGLYQARLLDAQGRIVGTSKVAVVH